jgi:hypothetical protein
MQVIALQFRPLQQLQDSIATGVPITQWCLRQWGRGFFILLVLFSTQCITRAGWIGTPVGFGAGMMPLAALPDSKAGVLPNALSSKG